MIKFKIKFKPKPVIKLPKGTGVYWGDPKTGKSKELTVEEMLQISTDIYFKTGYGSTNSSI